MRSRSPPRRNGKPDTRRAAGVAFADTRPGVLNVHTAIACTLDLFDHYKAAMSCSTHTMCPGLKSDVPCTVARARNWTVTIIMFKLGAPGWWWPRCCSAGCSLRNDGSSAFLCTKNGCLHSRSRVRVHDDTQHRSDNKTRRCSYVCKRLLCTRARVRSRLATIWIVWWCV